MQCSSNNQCCAKVAIGGAFCVSNICGTATLVIVVLGLTQVVGNPFFSATLMGIAGVSACAGTVLGAALVNNAFFTERERKIYAAATLLITLLTTSTMITLCTLGLTNVLSVKQIAIGAIVTSFSLGVVAVVTGGYLGIRAGIRAVYLIEDYLESRERQRINPTNANG